MPAPQENGNIALDEEHQDGLDAKKALVDKNLDGPVRTMHDNVTGTITRQAYDDQQATNAGVDRTLQEHTAGGISGFFGVKEAGSQYTAGTVADTTTDGNQAAIQARIAALSSRGPVLSQAANAQAANSRAANIDQSQQGQFRSGQLGLADMLTRSANGQGPSAAQAQLQAGTDASIAQSMALANSARGGNRSVALKQAMMQGGQATQAAANQSTQLRAQEMQAARGQLAGVLDSARGSDIGLATSQAGLTQQTALANSANQQQTALANSANQQQTNLANQTSQVQQQQNTDTQVNALMAQGMTLDQARMQTQIQQQQFNAGLLSQQEAARQGIAVQNSAQGMQAAGAVAQGAGAAIAALASDRKLKKGVKDGDADVRSLMDALASYSFEYKDPERFGWGARLGIMAQDLEKSKMGKALVGEEGGEKFVDVRKSVGAVLASVANLNARLKRVEK